MLAISKRTEAGCKCEFHQMVDVFMLDSADSFFQSTGFVLPIHRICSVFLYSRQVPFSAIQQDSCFLQCTRFVFLQYTRFVFPIHRIRSSIHQDSSSQSPVFAFPVTRLRCSSTQNSLFQSTGLVFPVLGIRFFQHTGFVLPVNRMFFFPATRVRSYRILFFQLP